MQLLKLLKKLSLLLVLSCVLCLFLAPTALAHTPHDDVFQVKLSPTYERDKTVLTIVRGNLFKSEDSGVTWNRVVRGLDHKHRLYALDISSQSAQTMFLASLGDGVYKSDNGGESWSKTNSGLSNLSIDRLKISPQDNNLVLAAGAETGLYLTGDGGANWQSVIEDTKVTEIAFAPDSQAIFTGDKQGNLLFSEDGGNSWQTLVNLGGESIGAIAVSPNYSQDRTLVIGTATGKLYQSIDGGVSHTEISSIEGQPILSLTYTPTDLYAVAGYRGVFQSRDGGNSWQELSRGLTKDSQAVELDRPYYSELAISPEFERDRTMFLAGYDGLFESRNGGKTWEERETISTKTIVGLGISPNYQQDGTVAIGTYVWGGYLSKNRGEDWRSINRGLIEAQRLQQNTGISRVFDLVFSPQYSSDRTIFSTTWYGIHKTTNRGKNWQSRYWDEIQPSDQPWWTTRSQGVTVAVSPTFRRDRTVYLGTMDGQILKSTDGGKNFSLISQLDQAIINLIVSPNFESDRTLYAAVPQKIYQSIDGGDNWELASDGISFNQKYDPKKEAIMQLAISPNFESDRTILVGTAEGIFQTKNRGKNWQKLTNTAYGDSSYIEGIAISPNFKNDGTFLVSVRGKGLFKTVDGGQIFNEVGNELIDNNITLANLYGFTLTGVSAPIQFSPAYSQDRTIFGFSDKQLFESQDAGNTWQALTIPIRHRNWLTYLYFYYLRLTLRPKLIIVLTSFTALAIYLVAKLWRRRVKKLHKFAYKA